MELANSQKKHSNKRSFHEVETEEQERAQHEETRKKLKLSEAQPPQDEEGLLGDSAEMSQLSSSSESSSSELPSILLSVPREVWSMNICMYLPQHDLASLRATSHWFRVQIVLPCLWKQWVPFNQLDTFHAKRTELGWEPCIIYGVYVKDDCNSLPVDIYKTLPPSLKGLDMRRMGGEVHFSHEDFNALPPSLEILYLPFPNDSIKEQAIVNLLQIFPKLWIEFAGPRCLLYWICMKGCVQAARLAFQRKEDLKHINEHFGKFGETPLYVSCYNGEPEIVELLLRHGANVNQPRTYDLCAPLTPACYNDHTDVVSTLLKNGADINHKSMFEKTALDVARFRKNSDTIFLLETHLASKLSS